jgi:hypothetical protein
VATSDQQAEESRLKAEIDRLRGLQGQRESLLKTQQAAWEATRLQQLAAGIRWERLSAEQLDADHQQLQQLEDLSIFASGPNPANDAYRVISRPAPGNITALRLDALRHSSHTQGGLARSDSGNFVLTGLSIQRVRDSQSTPVRIVSAEATLAEETGRAIKAASGQCAAGDGDGRHAFTTRHISAQPRTLL